MTNRIADVNGTFTAADQQSGRARLQGHFNVSTNIASGSPTATIDLERSFDDGATWHKVPAADGGSYGAQAEERGFEPANYVDYRLNCSALTGGNVGYRLSR